jgi:hypothetical protein
MWQPPKQKKESSYYSNKTKSRFLSARSIYYPIRPIFSLILGLTIMGLAWTPLLPFAVAVFIGTMILSDDLIMFPLLGLLRAKSNFLAGRKELKSLLKVVYTIAGYVLGAALAYFVLLNIPAVMAVVTMISAGVGCGIAVYMAAAFIGSLFFHYLNLPPILGVFLGLGVAGFIPPLLSVNVDVIAATSLTCGFVFSFLVKQGVRLANKIACSHTNADGYQFMHKNDEETLAKDAKLAKLFNVEKNKVTDLRNILMEIIKTIKKEDSLYQDIMGFRQMKTSSFKDILHVLLTAKNSEDIKNLKKLLEWQTDEGRDNHICGNFEENTPIQNKASWFYQSVSSRYGYFSLLTNPEAKYRYNVGMFYQGAQSGFDVCRAKRPELPEQFDKIAKAFTSPSPAA